MRVLIVDEDPSLRSRWHAAVVELAACDEATNGREAIALFRRGWDNDAGYDAVLMNVTMPDMDGHETLERFRNVEQEFGVYGSDGAKVLMFAPPRVAKQLERELVDESARYLVHSSGARDIQSRLELLGALDSSSRSAYAAT